MNSITITLPVHLLRAYAVKHLAGAALLRIEHARARAWWDASRDTLNSIPCGEADALLVRMDDLLNRAESRESHAATIIAAITAAGYTAPKCAQHALLSVDGCADTIVRTMPRYAKEIEQELREQAQTGRED
jgi:lambda repressor-like predicted transcriptional regulator